MDEYIESLEKISNETPLKDLLGKVIEKIEVADYYVPADLLIITTDNSKYYYVTEAACCSETWFADIIGIDYIVGKDIKYIEPISINIKFYPLDDGRCRQKEDLVYCYRIHPDYRSTGVSGFDNYDGIVSVYCDIIFRNSSNGYYTGNLILDNNIIISDIDNIRDITNMDDWSY